MSQLSICYVQYRLITGSAHNKKADISEAFSEFVKPQYVDIILLRQEAGLAIALFNGGLDFNGEDC